MLHGFQRRAVPALAAAALAIAVWEPLAGHSRPQGQPPVNPDAQLSANFQKHADAYMTLHRKLEATLPSPPKEQTPAQLDAHQRTLARLILHARGSAKQGDLFAQDIRAYFRRQIARALAGPDGAQLKDSIMEENPGKIQLQINGRYPEGVPLVTMPSQILAALPRLPDELEYRFLGRRLILLDVHAQIVVDYIEDALPR
jgi:hypothetical protein